MANKKVSYSFQETSLVWNKLIPQIFNDVEVKLIVNNSIYTGRGVDLNFNIAKEKAISESLERQFVITNGYPNSNGVACHFDKLIAIENSKKELLERDAYLCHFLTKTPFKKLNENLIPQFILQIRKEIQANGIKVAFLQMNGALPYKYIITVFDGISAKNKFGIVIGLSCERDLEESIFKSFSEGAKSLSGLLNYSMAQLTPKEKASLPIQHKYNSFNPKNYHQYVDFFKPSNNKWQYYNITNFNITSEIHESYILNDRYIATSNSDALQNLFFGKASRDVINIERLKRFSLTFATHNIDGSLLHSLG